MKWFIYAFVGAVLIEYAGGINSLLAKLQTVTSGGNPSATPGAAPGIANGPGQILGITTSGNGPAALNLTTRLVRPGQRGRMLRPPGSSAVGPAGFDNSGAAAAVTGQRGRLVRPPTDSGSSTGLSTSPQVNSNIHVGVFS